MDNKILLTIIDKFKGGPVGISTIATAIGEDGGTIEEVYEPFLIKEGYIKRTPRGREATEIAYKHLNKVRNMGDQSDYFKKIKSSKNKELFYLIYFDIILIKCI